MNRETSFRTSDTLVVTDRSRPRRLGNYRRGLVVAHLIGAFVVLGGGPQDHVHQAGGKGAGQIPTVTVIVPGQQPGRAHGRRERPARGQARPASRDRRRRAGASCACWSTPEAGCARARCSRWSTGRCRRSRRRSSPPKSRPREPMPRSPSRITSAPIAQGPRLRVQGRDRFEEGARDAAYAQVRVAQAQLGATRAEIGQLNVVAPAAGLILARNVEVGQIVSPGSPALFRLAEGGQMEMRAQLSQQDLAFVHVGMPAQVTPVGAGRACAASYGRSRQSSTRSRASATCGSRCPRSVVARAALPKRGSPPARRPRRCFRRARC